MRGRRNSTPSDDRAARTRHRGDDRHRCRAKSPTAIPFDQDTVHAAYDRRLRATASGACCASAHEVFARFRTGFLGKASPVHFFWGSFDLAVTRFSGRPRAAPPRRRAASAGCGGAGGLFARGVERRLLAGRRRADRLCGVLFLCLSGAGRALRRRAVKPGGGVLLEGARRIPAALRRGAHGARSRRRADGISAKHLRGGGRSGEVGPRPRWSARSAYRGSAGWCRSLRCHCRT